MTQTIALKDNYSLQIAPDLFEKEINVCLLDEVNNAKTLLAVWKGGKWHSDSPTNMSKMFSLIKEHRKLKRLINNSFVALKENSIDPTKTVTKTWNCFRRRVNVKIHNIVK